MNNKNNSFVYIIPAFLIIQQTIISGQIKENGKSFYVASWNVENLFDTYDEPLKDDAEFLPESEKQWTDARFDQKLSNLAKVVNYMNDGCGPDVIGLVEVENMNVVKLLAYKLRDRDYVIAHRESPDERGIDCALMYDRKVFSIVMVDTIRVILPSGYNTRYILHVTLNHLSSHSNIHFIVNHWPSRRGGEAKSEPNRWAAAIALKTVVDSLLTLNKNEQIILMGDFNDEPNNSSISKILHAKNFDCKPGEKKSHYLLNLSFEKFLNGEGSYLFGSDWNMIDQLIVSPALSDNKGVDYLCNSFEVIKPEFMLSKSENRIGGPFPTYSGNRYFGGFSDHFPVGAKFIFYNSK
jgi:predicted extracellular nuclease